ncbi:MAG: ABC transporter ATP-binding protein [Proteocatella sp.]
MIEIDMVSKKFDEIEALNNITLNIKSQAIFGLVGSNGAGKSTLMRIISGIIKPEQGKIFLEGQPIYENVESKRKIFYISDEQYFIKNTTSKEMMNYYRIIYKNFSQSRFKNLMKNFDLDENRKIETFSKGMKKQVSVILGLCSGAEYLLCDETFDGLDPVARQAVKSLLIEDIKQRGITPVIASHNLRELEDICDHIGLLHKGGVLLSKDLVEMKLGLQKVQCIFNKEIDKEEFLKQGVNVVKLEKRGSLYTLIAKGNNMNVVGKIKNMKPLFYEVLPLNLEEIFITETEVAGYDIKSIIL